jgi:hypothetical protein
MFVTDIASQLSSAFPGPFSTTTEYVVGGHYSPGDGGGGVFVWIVPGTAPFPAADGGIIIHNPNNTNGYFKRIFSGPVNVRWFGAIMGATDPLPTPHTITDVTTYVETARDSPFTLNGTIYFPEDKVLTPSGWLIQPYKGSFSFPGSQGRGDITILGDGPGTVLQPNANNDPILKLGYSSGPNSSRKRKVYNLVVDGVDRTSGSIGVVFTEPPNNHYFEIFAGSWVFDCVCVQNCDIGVYKPTGNLSNTFANCMLAGNNFGYYAHGFQDIYSPPTGPMPSPPQGIYMHSGCDKFIGGELLGNYKAGIFVNDDTGQYGH